MSGNRAKPCTIIAHRGFSAVAPENTLISAQAAIDVGADAVECDVRACKDGTLVLMHDETVDRTTNGTGRLDAMTEQEVATLDAGARKAPRYEREPVPLLDSFLQQQRSQGCRVILEIKEKATVRAVLQSIRDARMQRQVAVIAFSQDVVSTVRSLEKGLPCFWLCKEKPSGMTPVEQVAWMVEQARDCNTDRVNLHYHMLSSALISGLHAQHITVWAWTVNEVETMGQLMGWGVDGITTDRPDLLAALRQPE